MIQNVDQTEEETSKKNKRLYRYLPQGKWNLCYQSLFCRTKWVTYTKIKTGIFGQVFFLIIYLEKIQPQKVSSVNVKRLSI